MAEPDNRELPEAVARLAVARGGEAAFLDAHHLEAARRLTRLFARARLAQRVTMSYEPTRIGTKGAGQGAQGELSASAADARRELGMLSKALPHECWAVLFDICGLDRGMQEIEIKRDWPRRSGKLVLRIALSQLANRYGLSPEAEGNQAGRQRHWRPERVPMFSDTGDS